MKNIFLTIIAVGIFIFSGVLLADAANGSKSNHTPAVNTANQTNHNMPIEQMNQESYSKMPIHNDFEHTGTTHSTSDMGSEMGSGMGSVMGSGMGSGGSGMGSGMGSGSSGMGHSMGSRR
ncbi:MAG: hypothetical protein KKC46_06025 [Proteobacteria bacterium]|nr:hypothetical protein [Pseudomonadota bacterium]